MPEAAHEDIHVSGDKTAAELRGGPLPVTVIDMKKYAGRATDLNEILDRTAGVKVRQAGGVGATARISVRGLEGRRVAVFIDGHPITAPDDSFGINDIPVQLIDRIEIYKGVVPARLGGDGLGSAVNVVLRDRTESYSDLGYGIASYDVQRAFAFNKYVDRERGIKIGFGAAANYAANDYWMPRENGPPVRRDHDRFATVLAGGSLELTKLWFDKAKIEAAFVISRKEIQGVPPSGGSALGQYNVQEARSVSQLGVIGVELDKHEVVPGLGFTYDLLLPISHFNLRDVSPYVWDFDGNRMPSPNGHGEIGRGPHDTSNRRVTVHQRVNFNYAFSPAHSLNLNSDVQRTYDHPTDAAANASAGFNVTPYPGHLFRSVTGLSYEGKLADDRFMLVAGLKHFYIWSEGTVTSIYDVNGLAPPDPTSGAHQAVGWNAAARYSLTTALLAKASYERAARLPVADELFGNGFLVQGSTDLQPETSDNLTTGFYIDSTSEGGNRVQLDVVGFASRIRNLITLGGALTQNYSNVDDASLKGIEVDFKADLTSHVYVYANATFQDLRNETEFVPGSIQPNYLRGLAVPNVPPRFGNWGLELHGHWPLGESFRSRIFYDGSYVDEYFYEYAVSANQSRRVPRYVGNTIGVQETCFHDRYSVNLELNNIGDARRYDQFNLPLPGRSIRLFVRATFL